MDINDAPQSLLGMNIMDGNDFTFVELSTKQVCNVPRIISGQSLFSINYDFFLFSFDFGLRQRTI